MCGGAGGKELAKGERGGERERERESDRERERERERDRQIGDLNKASKLEHLHSVPIHTQHQRRLRSLYVCVCVSVCVRVCVCVREIGVGWSIFFLA